MKIKHLKYQEIDFFKWDQSIRQSFNGVIYAYSWYLDVTCNEWAALVMGDYDYLMPLPKGGRFFVKYFYQPFLSPYLGIFTTQKLTAEIINSFFERIPSKYKAGKLSLNIFNKVEDNIVFKKNVLNVQQLDLISAYIFTYSKYDHKVKEAIKAAAEEKYFVSDNLSLSSFVNFFTQTISPNNQKITYIRRLISYCIRYRSASLYAAYDNTNEICATCLFLTANNRTVCLLPLVSNAERQKGVLHLLIDKYIKKYSANNLVMDFFDSERLLPPDFFKGFGTTSCEYVEIERNAPVFLEDMLKKYIENPVISE